jgi:hypothetical protein
LTDRANSGFTSGNRGGSGSIAGCNGNVVESEPTSPLEIAGHLHHHCVAFGRVGCAASRDQLTLEMSTNNVAVLCDEREVRQHPHVWYARGLLLREMKATPFQEQ